MKKPDILLVNPSAKSRTYGVLSELSAIEPPLWCALLAAYIRQHGHEVVILDAEAENLGAEDTADKILEIDAPVTAIVVLGINPSVSSTPKMTAVGKILSGLRWTRTKTVLMGLHPSALPRETLKNEPVDYVAQGEGFIPLLQLLEVPTQLNNKIPGLWQRDDEEPPQPELMDVHKLPMSAWDLLPMEKYRAHNWHCLDRIDRRSPYAMIYTSLGCPYECTYCNIHAMYNNKPLLRYRDPISVAMEIDHLVRKYGVTNFKFMDEMFALNKRRVIDLCDRIAALGHDLNIWAYARADTVEPEMLNAMKKAGIRWLCFGFESASEMSRRGVRKKYVTARIETVKEMCSWSDINIIANFMVGLPDDTMETMKETLEIAKRLNFEYFNLYCVGAYPGSFLYQEAIDNGMELPAKWEDYSQYSPNFIPMRTKYLRAKDVLEFRDRAFVEYFDRPEYLNMIEEKFGPGAREHILDMLRVKVERIDATKA